MRIIVKNRDGSIRKVEGQAGQSLMLTLVEHDYDIEARCGGVAGCGTCHVYISAEQADRLPRITPEEEDQLALSPHVRPNSRLSCQITLDDALDALDLEIAPTD